MKALGHENEWETLSAFEERPDSVSGKDLTRRLAGKLHIFEEVNSTNDVAYSMALEDAPEGTVVIAESQTRGRGRMNRSWVSPSGKNLYLSLVLKPPIPPREAPFLTYMGAVATAEALADNFCLDASLKWPNDILVNGRKLAGLLNEVKAESDRVVFAVLGFGVNLNVDQKAFPPGLRGKATSVMGELGHSVSRVGFTRCLLESIEAWYETFLTRGHESIIEKWEALAQIRGKSIEVRSFGVIHRGVADGLDRDGALVLRGGTGEKIRVVAGDLREPIPDT
jgi:BirA family biotin operon repressor/biotin-[acetyl-CoA-carboxylase] ligase